MTSSMADLWLLTISAVFIFIILTTFIGTLILPFLNTSKKDARDLLLAVKDLTLPMGSFPSKLLRHRVSEVIPQVNPTEPIPQVKHDATHEVTNQTIPAMINEGEDSRLIATPIHPYIESAPAEKDSEGDLDKLFFDTFHYQSQQNDGAKTLVPSAEGQSTSESVDGPAEVFLGINQATVNEFIDHSQTDDGPAVQIRKFSVTSDRKEEKAERVAGDLSAMVKEKETLEAYIRQVVDPENSHGLTAMSLGSLIRWTMQEHEGRTRKLRKENNEREDQIGDAKQAFEAIIIGQNLAVREIDHDRGLAREEASELLSENWDLRESSTKAKEGYEERIEELRCQVKTAQEAAQEARVTAEEATTSVESRIQELKKAHAKQMSDAALDNKQKQNALTCSRTMVEDKLRDTLRNTRHQVTESEQQHTASMKDKNSIIKGLQAMIEKLGSKATTSERLAANEQQRLQGQLDDQRKEKEEEIKILRNQLRKSDDDIKALGGWKKKAEAEERNNQRASDRFKEEETSLRENHERKTSELKRNIKGLERTIGTHSLTITELERKVISLESGQEVKDLRSLLTAAQQKSKKLTNESESLRKRLQSLKLKTVGLENTIEDRGREYEHNKEAWTAEKGNLEHDLQQAKAESTSNTEGVFRKLEEEKQVVCTKVQSLEEEKMRTAEQHRNAINGKDQKIRRLEQAIIDNNSQLENRMEVEVARRLKGAVEAKEVEVWNEAVQLCGKRYSELEENTIGFKDPREAKKRFQVDVVSECRTVLEKINEVTKTENDLRTEIGALKSHIEGYTNATEPMSIVKANSEPVLTTKESSSLAREMEEANNLFEEIEEQGLPRICGERLMLKELNKAKKTLASVKYGVQQPEPDKNDLLFAISEARIDEGRFQQCDSRKRPVLLRQARAANGRLQSLQKILLLSTDPEVERDAVLAILESSQMNETVASPDEVMAHDTLEGATAHARQGQGELIMSEASETQNITTLEALHSGGPSQSLADILRTLQSLPPAPPAPPSQGALQSHGPQQETGMNGQGFAPPSQEERLAQSPMPGLFQSQGTDQAPSQGSLSPQSVRNFRRPVVSQPKGEIKMPRGFTARMRQWAKGWVRNGDVERAETLLLQHFQILQKIGTRGLRSYLGELKRQVECQKLNQMEQPGGWTDQMTKIVEDGLDYGLDTETVVTSVNMDSSCPTDMPDMDGVELYVKKLEQEYDSKPAPKPVGWTDEMTGTVMDAFKADLDTEFELIEELLMGMNGFEMKNKKGLHRYLERLKSELQAERENNTQHN